ncbi:Acyl-CoA thioesterase [Teladorsagia circumcincta]|uniref:Acyl-CoA thioesterase n=1 Tax=Teladorsagia circumcincta TaxID=45464 RepID=A0A2G9U861_TELCI|nr:Acyl-CoA thioesterase [Teladorsagia circumcincta]
MPAGPHGLLTARELMRNCVETSKSDEMTPTEVFSAYKLAEFPPTFHRMFEAKPVDQKIYKPDLKGPLHRPQYHLWIKPVLDIGTDPLMQQYMAAYISDSTMVETAILPHLARGFPFSMAFSLDHCLWFHQTKFDINEWMLWEQTSDFAGNSRTHTRARLWTRTGDLVMTAVQEGLARPVRKDS